MNTDRITESRQSLLQWVNQLLDTNFYKIEELGNGIAYCQILDSIYHDVPLQKLKFNPSTNLDNIQNYKILQASLSKHKIEKELPVQLLILNTFRDNYNLLKWLKSLHQLNCNKLEYNATKRLEEAKSVSKRGSAISSPTTKPRPTTAKNSPLTQRHMASRSVDRNNIENRTNKLQNTIIRYEEAFSKIKGLCDTFSSNDENEANTITQICKVLDELGLDELADINISSLPPLKQ